MLVLSRKISEQISFPGLNITITVLSVGQNRVQIGIDAPRSIDITRPMSNLVAVSQVDSESQDQNDFHRDFEACPPRSESHQDAAFQMACH